MRLRVLVSMMLAGVLCLAAVTPPEAVAARSAKPCAKSKGPTVEDRAASVSVRSLQARLYSRYRGGDEPSYVVYGCHFATRRCTVIGGWDACGCSVSDDDPPSVRLAGRFAAVVHASCSPPLMIDYDARIHVVDLRSGRTVRENTTTDPVARLLLRPDGRFAYLTRTYHPVFPAPWTLTWVGRSGSRVLDEGAGIDPGSLASDGRHPYWLNDGQPKVASLT
jgi:hypothetical protein